MTDTRFDLLAEPLFSVRTGESAHSWSLPEVLASLSKGTALEFEALQPHQQHPWHAFLTQLAAIALHRHGSLEFPTSPDSWTNYLLAITDGSHAPWSLVVSDLDEPAFMQPPIPGATLTTLQKTYSTPDAIDVLVTARNHDIKEGRVASAAPEEWAYALITLQTTEGFSGKLNYGIARMNGGFSSRPCVATARSMDWSQRFRRDASIWLEQRATLLALPIGYSDNGPTLLWLIPWDGTESLSISDLDPYFIEICRRVRLISHNTRLVARTGTSTVPRIAAKELHGYTGDIWTPMRDGAALTVAAKGFDYQLLNRILFTGDFTWNPALRVRPDDGPAPIVICQVLVRGQGQTDGWRQRRIHIPPAVAPLFGSPDGRSRIADLSQRRVEASGTLLRRVLRPALCALLQGDPVKLDFRDERVRPWEQQADARIDRQFFPRLWEDIDQPAEAQDKRWHRTLASIGALTLSDAIDSAPVPYARRFRAIAAAERVYYGTLKNELRTSNTTKGSP